MSIFWDVSDYTVMAERGEKMIDVLLYREIGGGKGYGFIQGGENAAQYGCERFMNFYCSEPGRSIRFIRVGQDCFMLLYVVAVPEGNHHESRGQIIASGYLFGMREADELMSHPEYILELKYCKSAGDLMEEGEINSWEQVRIHKGKNGRKKERTEILPPGELQKPYFTAVLMNTTKEINAQVFHSITDYSEGEAVCNLIKSLNLFPIKIRKYISWNTNVRKLTEAENYEWNFLQKAVLEEIEASGFAGGRAVKRIILCDKSVIRFTAQRSIDNAWIRFVEQYNEKGQQAAGLWMTETREGFASLLLETEKKEKRDTENRKRAHRIRCAGIRNEDVRNRIAMGIKTTALLILTVWTAGAIRIVEIGERTYTVSIHLDVFCAAGLFGIAYLLASLLSELKWRRRIKRLYQKSSGR